MKTFILLLCCTCCFSLLSYAQVSPKKQPEQEKLNIKGGGVPRAVYTPEAPAPAKGLPSDLPVAKTAVSKTAVTPAVPSPLASQGTPKDKPLNVAELNRKAAEVQKASKQQ